MKLTFDLIDNSAAHVFITIALFALLAYLCVKASARFEGEKGAGIYIICAWSFAVAFLFFASAVNNKTAFYILSVIGYICAFTTVSFAFKAADKIRKKHDKEKSDLYGQNDYAAHYIKCPSCGNGCPPGTTFCDECGHNINIKIQ